MTIKEEIDAMLIADAHLVPYQKHRAAKAERIADWDRAKLRELGEEISKASVQHQGIRGTGYENLVKDIEAVLDRMCEKGNEPDLGN